MNLVEMYTKQGCHLCDIARLEILSVKEKVNFDFVETDITSKTELFEKYKNDIPVIFVNKSFFSKYNVNVVLLRNILQRELP